MSTEHHIRTIRTARYYTLGELHHHTTEIWVVLHGYAQLAADAIQPFEALNDGKRFIVAPEGLSRFYARGFGGQPAAAWMTSADREHEISDYIAYLDHLYLTLDLSATGAKVIVLGFSQGVATASRWIHATPYRVDHFIIYSGEIATELQSPLSEKLGRLPVTYVTGTKDTLISAEKHQEVYDLMQKMNATIIRFDGGHQLLPEVIRQVETSLNEAGNRS